MPDPRFQILGPSVPKMIGRVALMERVWHALTKPAPSHISIVGPRFAGKSVFLNGLALRARSEESPYTATILWDLGHLTPSSDADFIAALSCKLRDELRTADGQRFDAYVDHLSSEHYGELKEVMDALQGEQARVLLLLDGLDRPLAADTFTRNLWDQLRELASQPSLRLVTASRQRLSELIRSAATATSTFWGIFDPNPVQIGIMEKTDIEQALAECQLGELRPGAEAQLRNWSGRFPPLLLALLNAVEAHSDTAAVTPQIVNSAAERALVDVQDVLAQLWDECPEPTKDVYRDLIATGSRPLDGIGWDQRERLLSCGFAVEEGRNRLRKSCQLLEQFVAQRHPDQGSVARLFRSAEGYQQNIRSILELRLTQLNVPDPQLGRAVQRSIEDLPNYPGQALVNMRNIAERCFAQIWRCEFGPERHIPAELFGYWNQRQVRGLERVEQLGIPDELGPQCRLLRLLIGAEQNIDRKARHISRQTYQLLDAVVGYGNYGQHTGGEDVGIGTAVAAVMTSLELLARLAEEHP